MLPSSSQCLHPAVACAYASDRSRRSSRITPICTAPDIETAAFAAEAAGQIAKAGYQEFELATQLAVLPPSNSPKLEQQISDGLCVASVTKRFRRTLALDNLSIHIGRGEIVGLFGRDGAGKTVCFEAIMGFTGIDSGHISLNGREITKLTVDRRGPLGLSYLAQLSSIFGGMTTAENISAVLEITEPNKATRALRLEQLLQTFKIDYVRDTPSPRLSGGERRRCEVARAMAASPSFMLLDEPFAGIDPLSVRSIKETIRMLSASNVGILMSDQNLHETLELVDRAYVIDFGKVIFHGTPREMLSDTDVRRCYLGDDFVDLPPVQAVRPEACVPQPGRMPPGHPTETLSATPALG